MTTIVLPEIAPGRPNTIEVDLTQPKWNVGAYLAECRKLVGLGQTGLADMAETWQPTISDLENGKHDGNFPEPLRTNVWKMIFWMGEKKAIEKGSK